MGCLLRFDISVLCLRNWGFLCCLFLLSLVDLEIREIPDGSLIAAAVIWLAALPFLWPGWPAVLKSLIAAVAFGGGMLLLSLLMDRILKRDSLGGGDIKLFAVVGLYLGIIGTLFALLAACVIGLLFSVVTRAKGGDRAFPFGPAIAVASAAMLLYGAPLIQWYGGLLSIV